MVARRVDALRRDVGRVAAGCRIVETDNAARLDRVGDDSMVVDCQTNDMRSLRRRRHRGIARLSSHPGEAQIARRFGGNLRRPRRACCSRVDDRRQRVVIDRDMLGGIDRLLARFGDDQRYRLADIAHLAVGEERLRREARTGRRSGYWPRRRAAAASAHRPAPPRRSAPPARPASRAPPLSRSARSARGHGASAARRRASARRKRDRRDSGRGRSGSAGPRAVSARRRSRSGSPRCYGRTTGPRVSGTVADFSFQSFDHGVNGRGTATPSTRISSTSSLKKERCPLIFGHSGIGSG